ncbi:MAG: hypothetical protein WBE18_06480 [Gammaproteobacteria bacterium]
MLTDDYNAANTLEFVAINNVPVKTPNNIFLFNLFYPHIQLQKIISAFSYKREASLVSVSMKIKQQK